VPSAADEIAACIHAAGGALRFDRFVDLALYGEHGFYTGAGRAGRRGDFLTSPEVGPLFGTVLSTWIDHQFTLAGRPDDFTVVEVGAGPGALARAITSVWATDPDAHPRHYVAVELSATQRATHPPTVQSAADLPAGPFRGAVVANELLDNLPFRLLVFDGAWREAHVAVAGDRFVEVLLPFHGRLPAGVPEQAPHGARLPLLDAAAGWIEQVRRLVDGALLVVDYVTPLSAELVGDPWRHWLRTYRGHERGGHYLATPGEQDITVQVPLDQLPEPDAVRTQAQFLRRWGIDELVEEGRAAWEAAASSPTVAAMKMRSRVREAEALCDPDGLGGFLVMEYAAPNGSH
jgi:SAM-dependent MidA family methyltransferase